MAGGVVNETHEAAYLVITRHQTAGVAGGDGCTALYLSDETAGVVGVVLHGAGEEALLDVTQCSQTNQTATVVGGSVRGVGNVAVHHTEVLHFRIIAGAAEEAGIAVGFLHEHAAHEVAVAVEAAVERVFGRITQRGPLFPTGSEHTIAGSHITVVQGDVGNEFEELARSRIGDAIGSGRGGIGGVRRVEVERSACVDALSKTGQLSLGFDREGVGFRSIGRLRFHEGDAQGQHHHHCDCCFHESKRSHCSHRFVICCYLLIISKI